MKGLDKKAAQLLKAHPAGKQGSKCYFSHHSALVPLAVALHRNGGEFAQIARILSAQPNADRVIGSTVSRHLRGECNCRKH